MFERNDLVIVVDQGSQSTRAMVFNQRGDTLAMSRQAVATTRPRRYWVEQDPIEIIDSVKACVRDVIGQLGEHKKSLKALALVTQRSSIVAWDKHTLKPLSAVLSWRDRRAQGDIDALAAQADQVAVLSGLRLSPHYGASKIAWLLKHSTSVRAAKKRKQLTIGPLSSFITQSITDAESALVDPANASRTLLYDGRARGWSEQLTALFAIDQHDLPQCVANDFNFGAINMEGLSIPLVMVSGDQSAALYAFGQPDPEHSYVNLGTGAFIQRRHQRAITDRQGLLESVVWADSFSFESVLEGTVNGAGNAIEWLAGQVDATVSELIRQWQASDRNAVDVPLFMNTVGGLGSPFWRADLVSHFLSQSSVIGKFQAVLESVVFLVLENLARINSLLGSTSKIIVSGGLSENDELCQWLADLSHCLVSRPEVSESTALGGAFLSFGRPKRWADELKWKTFHPQENPELEQRYQAWQAAFSEMLGQNHKPSGLLE